jgi:hypothetical protein
MGTAGAFLSDVEVFVKVNDTIRARVNTGLTARAFHRVNYHQPVVSLVYGTFYGTCRDAQCLIAVHTQDRHIVHLNLGRSSPDKFVHLQPELSSVWLRLGIGCPVIADMLILAGNLAAITSVAD